MFEKILVPVDGSETSWRAWPKLRNWQKPFRENCWWSM